MRYIGLTTEQRYGEERVTLPIAAKWLRLSPQTLRLWLKRGEHEIPYTLIGCRPYFSIPMLDNWRHDRSKNEYEFQRNPRRFEELLDTIPDDWTAQDLKWFGTTLAMPLHRRMILELLHEISKGASKGTIRKLINKIYKEFSDAPKLINREADRIIAMANEKPPASKPRRRVRPKPKRNVKVVKERSHATA